VDLEHMASRVVAVAQRERAAAGNTLDDLLDALIVVRPDLTAVAEQTRLEACARGNDFWNRSSVPHLTCSTMVVDRDGTVVLTLHARYGTWQQVGGHPADGERDPCESALREAVEETGLRAMLLVPVPVDLSIHVARCPAEEDNLHHDLCFIALTGGGDLVRTPESRELERVAAARVGDLTSSNRVQFLSELAASVAAVVDWTYVPRNRGVARASVLDGRSGS
jgi:8-oxo-dGTP pyrophosphatase MutT (NUDIX family)